MARPVNLPGNLPAETVETKHVRSVYDEIALHWHQTRVYMWPKVKTYVNSLPAHAVVLDVGCGNGVNMTMRTKDLCYVGLDISVQLLQNVAARGVCAVSGGQDRLPFCDGQFDSILSIAVIHHGVDIKTRMQSIAEIERCLCPGGTALVYAWNKNQQKFTGLGPDVLVPWQLQARHTPPAAATGRDGAKPPSPTLKRKRSEDGVSDIGIAKVLWRFYHLFEQGELEKLVRASTTLEIVESGEQFHNWYVVLRKRKNDDAARGRE